MDSENLSSLIRLSVSVGQKTDSSKVVSVIIIGYYGIFASTIAYLFIKLSSHWYAKLRRGLAEHHFGRSRSFSENAHNS